MIQVYAKADAAERVEELGSSVFLTDLTGWVQIDEGEGDRYAHAQGNYLEKPLMDAGKQRQQKRKQKKRPFRGRSLAGRNSWKRRLQLCNRRWTHYWG